jgi:hypothetical protein
MMDRAIVCNIGHFDSGLHPRSSGQPAPMADLAWFEPHPKTRPGPE